MMYKVEDDDERKTTSLKGTIASNFCYYYYYFELEVKLSEKKRTKTTTLEKKMHRAVYTNFTHTHTHSHHYLFFLHSHEEKKRQQIIITVFVFPLQVSVLALFDCCRTLTHALNHIIKLKLWKKHCITTVCVFISQFNWYFSLHTFTMNQDFHVCTTNNETKYFFFSIQL